MKKVIILTPDQKSVIEGPYHQFIVGPAGTGKTILSQAKALEALDGGKSVLIFSTMSYSRYYQQLLRGYDQKLYENMYRLTASSGRISRPHFRGDCGFWPVHLPIHFYHKSTQRQISGSTPKKYQTT